MKRGKSRAKADADKGQLSSQLADAQAKAAMLARSQGGGEQGIMAGFGQGGSQHYAALGRATPPPRMTDPSHPDFQKYLEQMMRIDPARLDPEDLRPPVRDKRDWAELLRIVPEGIYWLAHRGTYNLSDAYLHPHLSAVDGELIVEDATGTDEVEVHHVTLSAAALRGDDAELGAQIDEAVGLVVTREAMKLIGPAPSNITKYDDNPVIAMLRLLCQDHALYPVIFLAKELGTAANGEDRILAFAIHWVYEPALDEDDDEEGADHDDPDVYVSSVSFQWGTPSVAHGIFSSTCGKCGVEYRPTDDCCRNGCDGRSLR